MRIAAKLATGEAAFDQFGRAATRVCTWTSYSWKWPSFLTGDLTLLSELELVNRNKQIPKLLEILVKALKIGFFK